MKYCSFCGRSEKEVGLLIEGGEAYICKECSNTCNEEFEELISNKDTRVDKLKKPQEIKSDLDKYVIGQDEAKKMLSVAVYNHYKRVNIEMNVEVQKSNILLIGPTGSGKTYIMETLSKVLDVPMVIVDSTSLTEAGYVGEDVSTILEKLVQKSNGDISRAEKGIIYIDEIDKLANKTVEGRKNTKDVSGEGVQQALLKMIESSNVLINVGEGLVKKKVSMNTKNILFVCGGAFEGINEIVGNRVNPKKKSKVGFLISDEEKDEVKQEKEITQDDIIEFGFIPEFVGRVSVITALNELTKDDLKSIMIKPKNAVVKQYQALFKIDGVNLEFEDCAIDYIAEEALKKKLGARGLRTIIEKKMYNMMYDVPQQELEKIIITRETLFPSSKELPM